MKRAKVKKEMNKKSNPMVMCQEDENVFVITDLKNYYSDSRFNYIERFYNV